MGDDEARQYQRRQPRPRWNIPPLTRGRNRCHGFLLFHPHGAKDGVDSVFAYGVMNDSVAIDGAPVGVIDLFTGHIDIYAVDNANRIDRADNVARRFRSGFTAFGDRRRAVDAAACQEQDDCHDGCPIRRSHRVRSV